MSWDNISFGCHNLAGGSSYRRSERIVRCALDLGIRHFDLAPSYGFGTAERTLSRALGRRRHDEEIEITTKFGIPAPRFAQVGAWMREPYRILRSARAVNVLAKGLARHASSRTAAASGPIDVRGAAMRSLRTLQVERLGTFLTHERPGQITESLHDELSDLLSCGLIGKAGCSGTAENVRDMLALTGDIATVAQTSVFDGHLLPPTVQRRFFNLGALGRFLSGERMRTTAAMQSLRDINVGQLQGNDVGLFIAGAIAWARRRYPGAVLIVNASTPERLAAVVENARSRAIVDWIEAFDTDLENLFDSRPIQ